MPKKLPPKVRRIREQKKRGYKKGEKSVSFSQFNTYSQCNYRWYLTSVKRLAPYDPSIYTVFGIAFHDTFQHWLIELYDNGVKAADAVDFEKLLFDNLGKTYQKERKRARKPFTTAKELAGFYEQGIEILNYIRKKRSRYFPLKGWYLAGIEVPLGVDVRDKVFFSGAIDVVLFNKKTGRYKVLDIKTSTKGWGDYAKKDFNKTAQVIFYKKFLAEQFDIPIEKIDVEYFIVKRNIPDDPEYASMSRRVQEWRPAAGKINTGKAMKMLKGFVEDVFKPEGGHVDKEYPKSPSKQNCKFCFFKDDPLCNPTFF